MKLTTTIGWLALGAAIGCGPRTEAPPAATTEEEQPRRVTLWTDSTELYLEVPPFAAGQPSKMAIHLTDLSDFRPIQSGTVRIRFQPVGGGAPRETRVDAPKSSGLYDPYLTIEAPGEYEVDLLIQSPQALDSIRLPRFVVYDPSDDIPLGQPAPAGISFFKEQQWKTPGYRTAFADSGSLGAGAEVAGIIAAAAGREAIVSAPVAGILESAGLAQAPAPGTRVRAGQVLATLTPALIGSGGGYATARARFEEAEHEHARAKKLVEAEAAPARRLEEAAIALAAARAELATLGGGSADGRLALRSPIAGIVAERRAVVGGHAEAGAPLFVVVDPSVVWLEARVPQAQEGLLSRGRPRASFRLDGDDRSWSARRLLSVDPVIDPTTRTLTARFEVANPRGDLRIGAAARVVLETGEGEFGVLIPTSALVEEDGRPVGYVQLDGERFERRDLEIGARRGDRILVRRGIAPGERVVVGAAYQIRLASLSTVVPAHGHEH